LQAASGNKPVSKYAVIVVEDCDNSRALERSRAGQCPRRLRLQTTSQVPVLGSEKTVALPAREAEECSTYLAPGRTSYKDGLANEVGCHLEVRKRQSQSEIALSRVTRGDDGNLEFG
jgi:hypothetical protein